MGYVIVLMFSYNGILLFKVELLKKMVLVLGQECDGLFDVVIFSVDFSVVIDGIGNVESLNVFVVIGVLLVEWWC